MQFCDHFAADGYHVLNLCVADGVKAEGQKEADETEKSTEPDDKDEKANADGSEDDDATQDEAHYNKQKSFFDSISSESKNVKYAFILV